MRKEILKIEKKIKNFTKMDGDGMDFISACHISSLVFSTQKILYS